MVGKRRPLAKQAVRVACAGAVSVAVAIALSAPAAWSAERAPKNNRAPAGYPGPRCNDPVVIDQIRAEFDSRYWATGPTGVVILNAREANFDSWPQERIPRRFCTGMIDARGGILRPIYYAIIADGESYGLAWCVVGLDGAWVFDPQCRYARP
jgi:hypothetical protein